MTLNIINISFPRVSKTIICPLCNSSKCEILYKNYTGYIEGTAYDIISCQECKTHFIDPSKVDTLVYDKIYSETDISGYNRYYNYALKIKNQKNPLKYLAYKEETYFPIYKYLNDKKKLEILEIGSGYGYTTYAMIKAGHNVTGVDISKNAVNFANTNLGNQYICSQIEEFASDKKYDLIVATELLEHLSDPEILIKKSKSLLKNNGTLLITTPNKDYADVINPKAIWQSDLPPVHTFWATENGIEKMASRNGFRVSFFDFKNYSDPDRNYLIDYKKINRELIPEWSHITSNEKQNKYNLVTHWIKIFILNKKPVRNLSVIVLRYILNFRKNRTMAFFMTLKG